MPHMICAKVTRNGQTFFKPTNFYAHFVTCKQWNIDETGKHGKKRKVLSVWIFSIVSLPSVTRLFFALVYSLWIVKVTSPWNRQDYRIFHWLNEFSDISCFFHALLSEHWVHTMDIPIRPKSIQSKLKPR